MITVIALIIQVLISLVSSNQSVNVVVIPPMPIESPAQSALRNADNEWLDFKIDAYQEYADEFTALFNSYEVKRAKNNALMIRRGNMGSYKFAKKG